MTRSKTEPMHGRLSTVLFLAMVLFVGLTSSARADDFLSTPVTVVPVSNAPIAITKCKLGQMYWQQYTNITNRTTHALLNVTFRFNYFDADGAQIGTIDSVFNVDPPLVSGDDQMVSTTQFPNLSEPQNAIARVTCRMEAASFTGMRKWAYGERWTEPLSRMPSQTGARERSSTSVSAGSVHDTKPDTGLSLDVEKAWNDTVGGNLLVHAELSVHGGDTDMALRPERLALTMTLANNSSRSYHAMAQGAPTYQKFNPLGNTTTMAYEVDPSDDLGRLGSIVIPAHRDVKVIATFNVGEDPVANPGDNRRVAIR